MTCEDYEEGRESFLMRLAIRLSAALRSERSRKLARYLPRELRTALAMIYWTLSRTLAS